MPSNSTAKEVLSAALASERLMLVSHRKPDGDTLGSALAFGHMIERFGREPLRYCSDPVPEPYRFLHGADRVTSSITAARQFAPDTIAVFDAGDLRYAGIDELVGMLPKRPIIIDIDHHITNERFGDINFIVPEASSTAEVVYSIFRGSNFAIDRPVATCLLAGLLTDTGNFSNPATTAAALRLGAELLSAGADFRRAFGNLVQNKTIPALRLWGTALSRLRWDDDFQAAATAICQNDLDACGSSEESAEGISNFLHAVLQTDTVVVLREVPGGKLKASLRSNGDRDVSELAKRYGGGGHRKAAGFTMDGTLNVSDTEWKIIQKSVIL
ncbi:MAG: DHH family phosphoesterase [Patescibacteria group bacterium]